MEIAFQKIPPVGSIEPQPGEIFLVPRSNAAKACRALASFVFDKGPEGLLRASGPLNRIVVDLDPKLDDMLAVSILQAQLQNQLIPQGLDAFCRYAENLREGIRPPLIPLEMSIEGVYLAMRARVERRLSENEAGRRFAADWQRLSDAIFVAAKQQLDPQTDLLFALRKDATTGPIVPLKSVFQGAEGGSASEIAGFDFSQESEYLEKDRQVYQRDFEKAQRGFLRTGGAKEQLQGLILSQPKSAFLKYWTRTACSPPIGGPYPFLGISMGPRQWIFSIDPSLKRSLKPLADLLQSEEKKASPERSEKDPWFDGASLGHCQVASPRAGTKLSDETIRRTLTKWGFVVPSPAKSRHLGLAAAVVACAILAVGAWALFARRGGNSSESGPLASIHDLYVLNVGVSEYKNINSLHNAATDADALSAAFKQQQGTLCPKVVSKVLKDAQATRGEIIDYALRDWLLVQQPLTRRSLVVVTFSGHGFIEPGTNRYHFAPHDYDLQNQGSTGIFLADVQRYLATLPCTSVVLFDTCHSGGSDESDGDDARPENLLKMIQKSVTESRDQKGLVIFAACGRYQKANETARWGHGALTLAVLEAIEGKYRYQAKDLFATPLPQPAPGGVITLKDLDRYVTERVEVLSSEISTPKYRRQFAKTFTIGEVSLERTPIAVRGADRAKSTSLTVP